MLQLRTPNSNRNGLRSELGTARIHHGGKVSFHPGSRTPVTKSSPYWDYRFFSAPSAKYGNALALPPNHIMAALPLPLLPPVDPFHEPLLFPFFADTGDTVNRCCG